MCKLEGHAHAGISRELALAPAGFFGDKFENPDHAVGVQVARKRIGFCIGIGHPRKTEQIQAELHGIFPGSVRKFVDERLEDEAKGVAAWCAQRISWNA